MNCPRDGSELEYQGFWKYPRHVCARCRGVFVAERDVTESAGHRSGRPFADAAGVKLDNLEESAIRCPADATTLRVARYHDAEVDVCPQCKAVWLDSGELEKIAERARTSIEARRPAPKFKREEEAAALGPPPGGDPDVSTDDVLGLVGVFFRSVRMARRMLK